MNYSIRLSTEEDYPQILAFIKELALFEKAPDKVLNTVEFMKQEKHLFGCYVAVSETEEIIGIALYFFAYFTWVGKSLYLDDLYVTPEYRNMGIGNELLNHIFKLAKDENCRRLRWQVINWNTKAIELYKKVGATIDEEWTNCDFDYEQIKKF
ncbi:MAG: GNAT family N-acetyltransferase [Bacteroidales bacterium]|nr:GNAT family N-acetyltransferase [Bacteroidales bacterium]MDD4217723.1 GNAT family N-acetyltransferase [Bacteroidales bacterium]MDY0142119.1 GNAT family N-acetyltransferase [Bacteroidales bacterium]